MSPLDADDAVARDPTHVSRTWLTSALRDAGSLAAGEVRDVRVLSSRPTPVSTVTRLAVGYGTDAPGSAPTRLFLKTPKPELPREVSRQLGEREVRFYRDLAPAMPEVPLVRCYSAACSPTDGGGWHLLLDDLTDTHAPVASQHPPSASILASATAALAAIHARWWDKSPPGADAADRRPPDEPPPHEWAAQRRRSVDSFVAFLGDRLSVCRRRTYDAVVAELPGLRRRRAGRRPTTVVHGDAHLGNFLFPRATGAGSVCPLDWQDWWVGEPTRDVAYMVGKSWDRPRRAAGEQAHVRSYHARLAAGGVDDYSWTACWDDYRYSTIDLLFVPIGQWEIGLDEDIWWPHLERGMDAFEDLGCAELLSG
jgi:hypothetical protein